VRLLDDFLGLGESEDSVGQAAKKPSRNSWSQPQRGRDETQSNFSDDPLTKLWKNAEDRDTGAEAVAAIRARRQHLGNRAPEKRDP
jgi:hypothetical protein